MPLLPTGPAYCRPEAHAHFARVLANRPLDQPAVAEGFEWLFEAAWALSKHDMPHADFAAGETVVENLADAVRRRIQSTGFEARIAHLHDLLFEVIGFEGNTDDYYNPANSYLPAVLQSRRGIPITLALVYGRVAYELEIEAYGVNAPGHFLVEVASPDGSSMYVDPFYGGGIVTASEALARIAQATGKSEVAVPGSLVRATPRQWLSRMLFNLQAVFAATGRQRDVYAMQELQDCLGRL